MFIFILINKVAQLRSENKALKTQKKKLIEEMQRMKASEADVRIKGDSGRRLPEGESDWKYCCDKLLSSVNSKTKSRTIKCGSSAFFLE